jgi:hypothetical protein
MNFLNWKKNNKCKIHAVFCYDITVRYYLIVSFAIGIPYLIWGTVVYGMPWHWLELDLELQPVSFTRVSLRATVEGISTKLVRTDQYNVWKVRHAAR